MHLQLFGILSACLPKFFTDKDTGKQVEWFQSGIQTKDGFVVLTSKDLRGFEGKKCVFKVLANPAKLAKNAYVLKVIEAVCEEDGETVID